MVRTAYSSKVVTSVRSGLLVFRINFMDLFSYFRYSGPSPSALKTVNYATTKDAKIIFENRSVIFAPRHHYQCSRAWNAKATYCGLKPIETNLIFCRKRAWLLSDVVSINIRLIGIWEKLTIFWPFCNFSKNPNWPLRVSNVYRGDSYYS